MNKKIIMTFLMIITMTSATTLLHSYYRGGWGWGYGVGLGYGLGWGYPGWGYPGWGWGGYWGYPYYGYNYSRRSEEDARYYAEKAKNASLRAQEAEERIANVNRRRKLRRNNQNRTRPPHRYQTRTLPY